MLTKHIQRIFYIGLATVVSHAQAEVTSPVDLWDGVAITSTERTRLQLDISRVDKDWQAHLDLLDIGVRGWPAESVLVTGDRMTIMVRADSGPQKMQLTFANGRLVGTWQAPGFDEDATITLTRAPLPSPSTCLHSRTLMRSVLPATVRAVGSGHWPVVCGRILLS